MLRHQPTNPILSGRSENSIQIITRIRIQPSEQMNNNEPHWAWAIAISAQQPSIIYLIELHVGHSFPDIYFHSREIRNRFSHSREREFPTESGR